MAGPIGPGDIRRVVLDPNVQAPRLVPVGAPLPRTPPPVAIPVHPITIDVTTLPGIDNTHFVTGIDPTKFIPIIRPVKTVIVNQDPPAGTQVPFGTTVNLTLARLSDIPINVLKDPAGLSFQNLGDLSAAVDATPTLKDAVANTATFDALSAADKITVTTFATTHGGADPARTFGALKTIVAL